MLNFKVKYLQVSNNILHVLRNVYLEHLIWWNLTVCKKELNHSSPTQ